MSYGVVFKKDVYFGAPDKEVKFLVKIDSNKKLKVIKLKVIKTNYDVRFSFLSSFSVSKGVLMDLHYEIDSENFSENSFRMKLVESPATTKDLNAEFDNLDEAELFYLLN